MKSLFEEYGSITGKDFVRYNKICRQYGSIYNECYVLRKFDSRHEAIDVFDQWQQESKKMKTQTVTPKQYKFNLSIKLSPQDVENIIRERIVQDNPGINTDSIYLEDVTEGSWDEKEYDGYIVEWRNK